MSKYVSIASLVFTALLVPAGCQDFREKQSPLDGKVIWIRLATLEGTVWYSPGIGCLRSVNGSDILIDTSLMGSEAASRMEAYASQHNSNLDTKYLTGCKV